MTYDDEVIKEAEEIMAGAFESLAKERKKEHIHSLPIIIKNFSELIQDKEGKVHLGYIKPDEELDLDATIISTKAIDKSDVVKSPNDFTSAKLSLFYSFDDKDEAMACLEQPPAALLAHDVNPEGTAIYMLYKRKNYDIAVLIAANCLTVSRVMANNETVTESTDLMVVENTDGYDTPEKFFKACGITDNESELIKQLIEFHLKPQLMKQQFPNAYKVTIERLHKAIEESDDGEE